jgi:serine/threonine-protein kinase
MPSKLDTLPSRYTNARPIGSGGMGEIYRATDRELDRDVAVKVLAARYAQDEPSRRRFKREALAAARLSGHPNIVTIFDVAEQHDGRPMIVMAYLSGGSLEQRAKGSDPCPPGQVLDWLEEAAAALDAAHAAGIVHRDVKPGNLLLDDRGHVHVADFGIASAVGMDSFTLTGTILGTAGYLSPEQARGERATAASDRYALAIVAWELLTGHRPFEAGSPTEEAAAHVNAPVPSVHEANPSLPRAFDDVFRRALAKDPHARYSTAAEFVASLREAIHEDAGATRWIVPAQSAPAHVVRTGRTRRLGIPLLLVLLLAGGVLAAVLTLRGGDKSAATSPPTVVRTITQPGTTVERTVTTAQQVTTTTPATTPATTAAQTPTSGSGASLNDAGYAKMQSGDFAGARPLLEAAVQRLDGTGGLAEAYADYNLAYTRFALGDCTDVLTLLDRSEGIQGPRPPISHLRRDARKACD